MDKKTVILLHQRQISADIINQCIAEMLNEQSSSNAYREHNEGFNTQFDLIKSAFKISPLISLQRVGIATRLSLIDLFYTTNFNRFSEFGLEELTDTIWNLCSDEQGEHKDAIFVKKIESFVNYCHIDPEKARRSEVFVNLFSSSAKFGITNVGAKSVGYSAQSLISKYLFFLLETHHSEGNTLGYPIFDSIALDLQNPLIKKLGGNISSAKDMVGYVGKMTYILNCLKDTSGVSSSVWKMPQSVCDTQFGLLDYFLWRIGKSGKFSFSLLWSKDEKLKHYVTANNLKNKTSQNYQQDFQTLPLRFRQWHKLYTSIKEK